MRTSIIAIGKRMKYIDAYPKESEEWNKKYSGQVVTVSAYDGLGIYIIKADDGCEFGVNWHELHEIDL